MLRGLRKGAGAIGALGYAQTFYMLPISLLWCGALAHLVARVVRSYWGGDHSLFLGRVDNAAALMPWFDVLCVPSLVEPFGTVAAEALAAGTPAGEIAVIARQPARAVRHRVEEEVVAERPRFARADLREPCRIHQFHAEREMIGTSRDQPVVSHGREASESPHHELRPALPAHGRPEHRFPDRHPLSLFDPLQILKISTVLQNVALGFSARNRRPDVYSMREAEVRAWTERVVRECEAMRLMGSHPGIVGALVLGLAQDGMGHGGAALLSRPACGR